VRLRTRSTIDSLLMEFWNLFSLEKSDNANRPLAPWRIRLYPHWPRFAARPYNGVTETEFLQLSTGYRDLMLKAKLPDSTALLCGFPRSGTSYLHSVLQQAMPNESLTVPRGSIWLGASVWKHTPAVIGRVSSQGGLVCFVPLRPLLDCLVSWAIKSPEIMNREELVKHAALYFEVLNFGLSSNSVFVPFDNLESWTPAEIGAFLQEAFAIRTGSAVIRASSNLGTLKGKSAKEVFLEASLGDATGLDAKQSLANPLSSHLPNREKEMVKESVRGQILDLIPGELLLDADKAYSAGLSEFKCLNPSWLS